MGTTTASSRSWGNVPGGSRIIQQKGWRFWSFWKCFWKWNSHYCVPFWQYHYGQTKTVMFLTTQTDLSRTDGCSRYCIPFETLMPRGKTIYMVTFWNCIHHELFIVFHLYKFMKSHGGRNWKDSYPEIDGTFLINIHHI